MRGKLILNNCSVINNTAEDQGGGIYYENNTFPPMPENHITLNSSIVSNNTAESGQGNEIYSLNYSLNYPDGNGYINADSFNLFGHSGENEANAFYNFVPGTNDVNATDGDGGESISLASILDTTLANNGGSALTHALVPGSPAIDLDTSCGTEDNPNPDRPLYQQKDQRGTPRPIGDGCDAGSFEFKVPGEIIVDAGRICTLDHAITAANTDTASGGCPAGSGEDTIYLETDVTLDTALPEFVTSIIIKGQDHTVDGNNDPTVGSVLRIGTDGNLKLYNTTVMGGRSFLGGGINNQGELALINSVVKNNSVSCLDSETDAVGGGIYNKGSLTLSNSLVNDNSALCSEQGRYALGGGIVNGGEEATASLSNSTITSNSVSCSEQGGYALGGGIVNGWSAGGALILDASTVNGNSVSCSNGYAAAGGIANVEDGDLPVTLTLTNSTVSGNVTLPESSIYRSGGGIANWGAEAVLNNSTITDNLTSSNGGGIENIGGAALTLKNSIVSGNTATSSGHANEIYNDSSSTVTANSYNLFGHSGITDAQTIAGFTPGFNDTTATSDGTNPTALSNILGPLADNGGATMTHALVPGSPALDLDASCSALQEAGKELLDQRGEPRPVGAGCDAGSFEAGIVPPGKSMAFLQSVFTLLLQD
jgi:hypothetical protein